MKALSRRQLMLTGAAAYAVAPRFVAAGAGKVHDIRITGFVFEPEHLSVKVGDTIRWTNEDLAPHTATENDFAWDTGELARGESAEIQVVEGMAGDYFCQFHPHMKARLDIVS